MAKDLLDEDQTRFSNAAHRRCMWLIGSAIVCVFALFVMIATPLLVLNAQDHRAAQRQMREVSDMYAIWEDNITERLIANALATANVVAGCVQARMHSLAHHAINDTHTDDLYNAELDRRFHLLASLISTEIPFIAQQMMAPAGIVTYLEPYDTSVIGHNMFDPSDPVFRDEPSAYETMRNGKIIVIGPYHVQTDVLKETWALVVRQPVFNTSNVALQSEDNFWGFTNIFLNVTSYLLVNNIEKSMKENDMDYLLYGWTADGTLYEVASSLPPPVTQRAMKEFILSTTDSGRLLDQVNFSLAMRSHRQVHKVNANMVCITVAVSAFIVGLAYFLCALLILHCMTLYDGRRYAPKRPPFAVLTVGPCYGEELWNLVPAQMAEVTESLNRVLDRQMAAHHAYKIFQMHPYTTSYVIHSVEGAVKMAFSILEELQRQPIDEPLTMLLGEDGRLLTSLAVHWCSNATVTLSLVGEDTYRYEGPDIVYGARMWIFASPNTVTISAAAQAQLSSMPGVVVEQCMSIFLRGVEGKQYLHTATMPNNKYLADAVAIGAERMRKEYEAQRQLLAQARRESEATHNSNGASHELGASSSFSVPAAPPSPLPGVVDTASHTCSYRSSVVTHHLQSVPTLTVPVASVEVGSHHGSSRSASESGSGPRTHSLSDVAHSAQDDKTATARAGHVMELFDATQGTRVSLREAGEKAEGDGKPCTTAMRPSLSLTWSSANLLKLPATPIAVLAPTAVNKSDDWNPANTAVEWSSEHAAVHGSEAQASRESGAASTTPTTRAGTAAATDAQLATFDELPDRAPAVHSPFRTSITHLKKQPKHIAVPLNPILANATTTPPTSAALALSTAANRSGTSVPVEGLDTVPLCAAETLTGACTSDGVQLAAVARRHTIEKHDAGPCRSSTESLEEANSRRHTNEGAKPVTALPTETPLGVDNPLRRQVSKSGVAHSSAPSTDAHSVNSNALFQEFGPLTDGPVLNTAGPMEPDAMLLQRAIPVWLDNGLRRAFEHHAIVFDISYESVRVIVFCFYSGYKLLFRPLSKAERNMIFQRLVGAFGVPRKGILEHLAARCALRYLQDHENMKALTIERPSGYQAAT